MKKSLVALAVASIAGAAFAQSSVTVYGIVDTGYSNYSNDGPTGKVRQSGLSSSNTITNRLGFRGVEDLGGGLKAKFNLEMGYNADDGAGQITTNTGNVQGGGTPNGALVFSRLAYVALESKLGEIRLGRDIHPGYYNYVVFDPFGAVGAAASLPSVQMFDGFISTGAHVRFSNGINYFLPSGLGGLYGQLAYAPGEQASNAVAGLGALGKNDGESYGARIGYAAGPVNFALGYSKVKASVIAPGAAAPNAVFTGAAAGGSVNDRETLNLAGTFDFGVAKLWAQLARVEVDNYANRVGSLTGKSGMIGVTVPLGAHLLKASYAQSENSGQNEWESKKFGLGYEYRFSKRTAFYTSFALIDNDNGGRTGVGSVSIANGAYANGQFASGFAGPNGGVVANAGSVAANGKSRGFDVGLRHAF
ncbi:MAG: porin [Pseudomonadota bacterium]